MPDLRLQQHFYCGLYSTGGLERTAPYFVHLDCSNNILCFIFKGGKSCKNDLFTIFVRTNCPWKLRWIPTKYKGNTGLSTRRHFPQDSSNNHQRRCKTRFSPFDLLRNLHLLYFNTYLELNSTPEISNWTVLLTTAIFVPSMFNIAIIPPRRIFPACFRRNSCRILCACIFFL